MTKRLITLLLAVLTVGVGIACENGATEDHVGDRTAMATDTGQPMAAAGSEYGETGQGQVADAQSTVDEAVDVVRQMKNDPDLADLLQQAKGVLVVPDYGKGALVVGGRGGEGVLVARQNGSWSDPVFYDIGAVSVGAQAGVTAGQVAMLLMTDKAVDSFKGDNNFSLNADAGFTIVDYSARSQASEGKGGAGDVIFWSDTEGAFAGASLSATDISFDDEENPAYYHQGVTAQDILSGQATNPQADTLQNELPA